MTDRNPAKLMEVVAPFQSCTVQIGGDLVLTGYIDTVEPFFDKGTHHHSWRPRKNRRRDGLQVSTLRVLSCERISGGRAAPSQRLTASSSLTARFFARFAAA
jgi:hypothetical protein